LEKNENRTMRPNRKPERRKGQEKKNTRKRKHTPHKKNQRLKKSLEKVELLGADDGKGDVGGPSKIGRIGSKRKFFIGLL